MCVLLDQLVHLDQGRFGISNCVIEAQSAGDRGANLRKSLAAVAPKKGKFRFCCLQICARVCARGSL